MSGPFPKPIYTINGITSAGNTGNISLLATGGLTVSSANNAITISGSGGGSVPAPTANGQIPIGSANGTFTTTTLTGGPGITITDNPGSITISSPVTPLAQVSLSFIVTSEPIVPALPGTTVSDINIAGSYTSNVGNPTSRLDFSAFTVIIPATNLTLDSQQITFTQAGTYLIQLNSNYSGGGVYFAALQLVLNGTNVLFATGASSTTGVSNVNLSYLASFAIGDTIDFRLTASGPATNPGFTTINVLVNQIPTAT